MIATCANVTDLFLIQPAVLTKTYVSRGTWTKYSCRSQSLELLKRIKFCSVEENSLKQMLIALFFVFSVKADQNRGFNNLKEVEVVEVLHENDIQKTHFEAVTQKEQRDFLETAQTYVYVLSELDVFIWWEIAGVVVVVFLILLLKWFLKAVIRTVQLRKRSS